jgi:hypothetical protein
VRTSETEPADTAALYRAPSWEAAGPAAGRRAVRPLALIGATLIIAGGVLPWIKFHWAESGFKIPAKYLVNGQGLVGQGLSIGLLLVIIGAVALVLCFLPSLHVVRRVVGLLGTAVPVVFVVQAVVHNVSASTLIKDLGPGEYCAFVGGILALVG